MRDLPFPCLKFERKCPRLVCPALDPKLQLCWKCSVQAPPRRPAWGPVLHIDLHNICNRCARLLTLGCSCAMAYTGSSPRNDGAMWVYDWKGLLIRFWGLGCLKSTEIHLNRQMCLSLILQFLGPFLPSK